MKVLHTITDLNLSSGGAASATYNLFNELTKKDCDITMLTLLPQDVNDEIIAEGNNIKALKFDGISPFVYSKNLKQYLETHNEYDIYHANGIWTYPTYKTLKTANKREKASLVTIHGMLNRNALKVSYWQKKLFMKLFQYKQLQNATIIHSTSMYEAECIREVGLKTPIALIPNGIITDNLPKLNNTDVWRIGFVGRLDRIKNIESLIKAWGLLKDKTKDCELLIIGGTRDDNYKNEILKLVQDLKLDNIRFTGQLTPKEVKEEIAKLRILILPSHSENFGMVIPEALSMGIPCIASKNTPWEDLKDYNCGWWVNNDYNTLAETILETMTLPKDKYYTLSRNGIILVNDKYSISATSNKMIELYDYIYGKISKPNFII